MGTARVTAALVGTVTDRDGGVVPGAWRRTYRSVDMCGYRCAATSITYPNMRQMQLGVKLIF